MSEEYCPFCAERIQVGIERCPYCKRSLIGDRLTIGDRARCPYCAEEIDGDLNSCPYCGRVLRMDENSGIEKVGSTVRCPFCAEEIEAHLDSCPYCEKDLQGIAGVEGETKTDGHLTSEVGAVSDGENLDGTIPQAVAYGTTSESLKESDKEFGLSQKNPLGWGCISRLFSIVLVLFLIGILNSGDVARSAATNAIPVAVPTATGRSNRTPTRTPRNEASSRSCLFYSQISERNAGEIVCVRSTIHAAY